MNIPQADTTTLKGVVIPDAFKQPDWIEPTYDKFKKMIKEDYSKNKVLNPALVRKALKQYLLDDKISPPYPLNKKNVGKLLEKMYKLYDDEEFQWRYMLIYQAGFFLSTLTSISFTPDSLELPKQFKGSRSKVIQEFKKKMDDAKSDQERERAIHWVDEAFKKLTLEVLDYFRANREQYPIIDSLDSKAKGDENDFRKLLVAVGLSINAKSEINDVIEKSHSEALTPTQFFNYTSQAIVSQYKKSRETAAPGYLIRQLNTIMVSVKLSRLEDCKTSGRLSIKVQNKDMLKSMEGKVYDGGVISPNDTELVGKTIKLRSALHCKAKDGICATCYNPSFIEKMNLSQNAGIGLLASTSQAGLLTNMTLKAAHTGLSLDKSDVDLTNDVFEYSD